MRWLDVMMMASGFAALGVSVRPNGPDRTQVTDPQSILDAHCVSCHSGASPAAHLDLSKGSETLSGLYVIAKGDPDNSLLVKRIIGKGGRPMPPNGPPLSDADTAVITDWIKSLKPDPTPIFQVHCVACHSGASPAGHLDLSAGLKDLASSTDVVIGEPDKSLLVKRVTGAVTPQMPPGKPSLSDQEIKVIKDWVSSLNDPTPILYGRCMPCHRGANAAGGLNLAVSRKALASLSEVTKGDPDNSLLVQRITGKVGPQMPPAPAHPLSNDQIASIQSWIRGLGN